MRRLLVLLSLLALAACNKAGSAYDQGIQKLLARDAAGALASFEEAIKADPEYAPAYAGRGYCRQKAGDADGAYADYNRAIELKPSIAVAYHNRGVLKYRDRDLAGAIADWEKFMQLASGRPQATGARLAIEQLRRQINSEVVENPTVAIDPFFP